MSESYTPPMPALESCPVPWCAGAPRVRRWIAEARDPRFPGTAWCRVRCGTCGYTVARSGGWEDEVRAAQSAAAAWNNPPPSSRLDASARAAYAAYCAADPVAPREPDWGRSGYKVEAAVWQAVAAAALRPRPGEDASDEEEPPSQ